MFPPRLPTHSFFFTAKPRTLILRRPLLSLRQPRVKSRPTVPHSRLRPRRYLSCLPFLRLARLPLSRQISFRQGRAGVKPPPLVPPGLPSITVSCALTLRHRRSNNQSPPRDSPDGHDSPRPPTRGPPVQSTRPPPPPLGMPLPRLSLFRRFLACKARKARRPPFPRDQPQQSSNSVRPSSATRTMTGREQRAEPACDAAIRYLLLGSPAVLPNDFLSPIPSHKRPLLCRVAAL